MAAAGTLAACGPGGSPIGVALSVSAAEGEGGGASRRCDTITSGDFGETVGLIGHDERIDQPVDVTIHDPWQVRQVEPDPVIGQAVLREVVGPDLLGPVAAADHRPPSHRVRLALLGLLARVESRAADG